MTLNRFLLSMSGAGESSYILAFENEQQADAFNQWISAPQSLPPQELQVISEGMAAFSYDFFDDTDAAIRDNLADVAVLVQLPGPMPPDAATEGQSGDDADGDPSGSLQMPDDDRPLKDDGGVIRGISKRGPRPVVTLSAIEGDGAGQAARRILIERLLWLRNAGKRDLLRRAYGPEIASDPFFNVKSADVEGEPGPPLLATIFPIVLVLMTITGAVYPAIDLTAGERERGTMEALIASPVPRGTVLFAKYVAVVSVAVLTAIANLGSMWITLQATGLISQLAGESGGISVSAMLMILLLLILFAAFFSAVLLSLTSFAKSFKEAQAYLIPVMLLSITPALFTLLPGVTLNGPMAAVPLVNIVLLARDVLHTGPSVTGATVAILTTIAYAVAALSIASRLFGSDAVQRTS
ncbi:MAG: ABC transporter permease subunit, partial [Planctomycetota bacterium]